jgi:dipeptidyl aminopeptidase/acylaminoacyl peptidase
MQAGAALPADVYAALPEITQARLSPDGQFVAMTQPVSGAASVTIYKVGAGGTPCAFAPRDVNVLSVSWASSQRLLVNVSYVKTVGGEYRPREYRKQILIDTSCKDPKLVLGNLEQVRESRGNTEVIGRPPGDLNHILVASFGFSLEIYKVDPNTGIGDLVYSGSSHVSGMARSQAVFTGTIRVVLDQSGTPRIRYDVTNKVGDIVVLARPADSDNWAEIYRYTAAERDQKAIDFQGFGSDPNIAYAVARNGDRAAAYEFDLRTKSLGRILYQDPKVDVDGFFLEPYTRRVMGLSYTALDGTHVRWMDQSWAKIDADLHATFERSEVFISSATADFKKFTVYVEGPEDPAGNYYFYDSTKPEIFKIGGLYPRVTPAEFAQQRLISYKARDGLEIPAYVTTPPGASAKNMPLVVMPHGGPASRDEPGFQWWAQFVATRGFVVLQPQFRGSEGFGKAFEEAGHHKWGLEMQNDISDGVKYMIDQGLADPKKVCIVGWSYGGYAAMAGVTLTPELYKCGIAVAGVSNLITMLGYEAIHHGMSFDQTTNYWPKVIGDPTRHGERLRATSPALHADRITASFLMIHGANDTVVPIEQSEQMAQAMDKAGKPYQFVRVTGDDHQMRNASSRKQMLEAMDKFLQQQLK